MQSATLGHASPFGNCDTATERPTDVVRPRFPCIPGWGEGGSCMLCAPAWQLFRFALPGSPYLLVSLPLGVVSISGFGLLSSYFFFFLSQPLSY